MVVVVAVVVVREPLRLRPSKLGAAEDTQMTLVLKSAQEAQLEIRPRALLICSAPHPCRQERQVEDASLRGDFVGVLPTNLDPFLSTKTQIEILEV